VVIVCSGVRKLQSSIKYIWSISGYQSWSQGIILLHSSQSVPVCTLHVVIMSFLCVGQRIFCCI